MANDDKTYTQAELDEIMEAYEEQKRVLEDRAKEAELVSLQSRIQTDFLSKALQAGVKYVDDAYKLADLSQLNVTDEKIDGMEDAVKRLITKKPYLLAENVKPKRNQRSIGGSTN